MEEQEQDRPDCITSMSYINAAIGLPVLLFGVYVIVGPNIGNGYGYIVVLLGLILLGYAYGLWTGAHWAWSLGVWGGGITGKYFARDDVKEFFGELDGRNEGTWAGD